MDRSNHLHSTVFGAVVTVLLLTMAGFSQAAPAAAGHALGAVKAVSANGLTITTDAGSEMSIDVPAGTSIVRLAPGQKDLKSATPTDLSDVQPGDRVLARGTTAADGKSITATSLIVMKQSDIAQKQQQEREDWQRRGVGGLITAVDPAAGTVTITSSPGKSTVVHVAKNTIIRRYAPDSVQFDDAKLATLDQIKVGDQLRARGEKSADGSELQAEEIVSGTFRNIAGTVISTDPANHTVTLKDLATKQPVTIKVSADSQMRQLPEMMARFMAMRLKGGVTPPGQNTSTGEHGNAAGAPGAPAQRPAGAQQGENRWQGGPAGAGGAQGWQRNGAAGGGWQGQGPRNGPPDLQQILSRMPAVSLSDLHKDEAVMVVATEGSANSAPTVITLLTGVEPILSASPNDNRATMMLSPWSLGGGASMEGMQ
jgi:hypothetical protein